MPTITPLKNPVLSAEEGNNNAITPEAHVESLGGELIKQEGRVLVRLNGTAVSRELRIPYSIVPADGILANSSKWRGLSAQKQLQLVMERVSANSVRDFQETVNDFVGSVALTAEKNGLDPLPFLQALSGTTMPQNFLFDSIEERLETAVSRQVEQHQSDLTRNAIQLANYPATFTVAAAMPRKFVALLGPTNSGKTHAAMEALAAADTGVYLAPLRLLALENYERLCRELAPGKGRPAPVSLITGDEKRIQKGATHIASTIEMLDMARPVDVGVIDEIQLLADPDRGAAWTAAVCGAPASTVYLVGAVEARAAIEALAKRMNVPLEVKVLQRKGPLSSLSQPVAKVRNLRPGDALITFSRREVLAWRDAVTAAGFSVSTLYGNLSPEVRRAQAQRFVDGEADIVVATDVIGMGLNLPCARVIFSTTEKFNGVENVELAPALAKQIAGRAGRFGQHEEGFFAGFDDSTHRVLQALMKEKSAPVPTAGFMVSPSLDQLQTIAGATGEASLAKLLSLFEKNVDGNDGFFLPRITSEQAERALWLDTLPLSLSNKFTLSLVPISTRFESLRRAWESWSRALVKKMPCHLEVKSFNRRSFLQEVEDTCKLYSAYAWLAYRQPEYFPDGEKAVREARMTSDLIDDILRQQNAANKATPRQKSGAARRR